MRCFNVYRRRLIIVWLALINIIVWASALSADVSRCFSISEDLDRLTCYDQEAGYTSKTSSVATKSEWIVDVETSKIDDSKNVFMRLRSFEQSNCPYKSEKHEIYINCRENVTRIYIGFGGCFMSDLQGRGKITYRLDKEKARTKRMGESTDHSVLGLWNGAASIPFIKSMFGHSKMLVRATPFSESAVTGEYNIAGLEEAIKPLREACDW